MTSERPKGVIRLGDKDFPTWPFVLDKAHDMGLIGIETELVETPNEANSHSYIVKARASFRPLQEGDPIRVFTGYGDAGPKNVSPKIAGATLRMAETRAMGRALRTATNIGETLWEELPGDDDHAPAGSANGAPRTPHAAARAREAPSTEPPAPSGSEPGARRSVPAGFERTFSKPGTRQYSRDELLQGAAKLCVKAVGEEIETVRGHLLIDLDFNDLPNEELFALAESIQQEMKAKKEAAA